MRVLQKNQKGFGAIETLLILILVAIVAFAGWYIWDSNKKTQDTQNNSNSESQAIPESKKYLEIKELGLKFELDDTIKDAYYYFDDEIKVPYFSVHHFDNLTGFEGCRAIGDASGLGALSYGEPGDDRFGSPMTEEDLEEFIKINGGKKIDNTYYWFEPASQASCWDIDRIPESNKDVQMISTFESAFGQQMNTLTKL